MYVMYVCMYVCMYVMYVLCMLAIAGQTAAPNWLICLSETHGCPWGKIS